jgi:hypothetical protein
MVRKNPTVPGLSSCDREGDGQVHWGGTPVFARFWPNSPSKWWLTGLAISLVLIASMLPLVFRYQARMLLLPVAVSAGSACLLLGILLVGKAARQMPALSLLARLLCALSAAFCLAFVTPLWVFADELSTERATASERRLEWAREVQFLEDEKSHHQATVKQPAPPASNADPELIWLRQLRDKKNDQLRHIENDLQCADEGRCGSGSSQGAELYRAKRAHQDDIVSSIDAIDQRVQARNAEIDSSIQAWRERRAAAGRKIEELDSELQALGAVPPESPGDFAALRDLADRQKLLMQSIASAIFMTFLVTDAGVLFLVLRSLYGSADAPTETKKQQLESQLRENIIRIQGAEPPQYVLPHGSDGKPFSASGQSDGGSA